MHLYYGNNRSQNQGSSSTIYIESGFTKVLDYIMIVVYIFVIRNYFFFLMYVFYVFGGALVNWWCISLNKFFSKLISKLRTLFLKNVLLACIDTKMSSVQTGRVFFLLFSYNWANFGFGGVKWWWWWQWIIFQIRFLEILRRIASIYKTFQICFLFECWIFHEDICHEETKL